jgi:hypothetical protein
MLTTNARAQFVLILSIVATATSSAQTSPKADDVGYRPQFGTMWTFDAPPLDSWKKTYGFSPDQAWLDNARLASVRLPNCSASFVSSKGLILTNHHCVSDCEDTVSPKDTNLVETGYAAASVRDEKKCPGLYVDQLESIENVTQRVNAAVTAASPEAAPAVSVHSSATLETLVKMYNANWIADELLEKRP